MRRLFIFLSIIPALVWGQDSLNVRKVGELSPGAWGHPTSVQVLDSLVFFSSTDAGLMILNISNLARPLLVGKYNPAGTVVNFEISGQLAYLTGFNLGLQILDITNINEPVELGNYSLVNNAVDFELIDSYCYYADAQGLLRLIDVSDPNNLIERSLIPMRIYAMQKIGDLLFAGSDLALRIFDVSNIATPVLVDSIATDYQCRFVSRLGNYLMIGLPFDGIRLFDVGDPHSPIEISHIAISGEINDLAVAGDNVFRQDEVSGLTIYDYSDPANPVEVSRFDSLFYDKIAFHDSLAVSIGLNDIQFFDISAQTEPRIIGGYSYCLHPASVALNGNYLYVGDYLKGLLVVEISQIEAPIVVNCLRNPRSGNWGNWYHLAMHGQYLLSASQSGGFQVYDVSSPAMPRLVTQADNIDVAQALCVENDRAYVANRDTVRVFDISNLPQIVELGDYIGNRFVQDIVIENNVAYLSRINGSDMVVDFSAPHDPQVIFEYGVGAAAMAINDSILYMVNQGALSSPRIYDVSDPRHPILANAGLEGGYKISIKYNNGFAFIGSYIEGFMVADARDPFHPVIAGFHRGPGYSWSFAIEDSIVFAANDPYLGVYIFTPPAISSVHESELPSIFSLHPIYPNPFNNTANITFDLPREVTGRLVVYDVLGRMTNTLYDGKLAAGSHQMQFSGDNLSSGTYFVKLESPAFNSVQKAVLVK